MTKQQIEDIIRFYAYPIIREEETLYLLDKEQIEEIAKKIRRAK